MDIVLRKVKPEDAEACGRICYEAFTTISQAHNFPRDFPNAEVATSFIKMMVGHPGYYGVVAEEGGRVVGSNFIDLRNAIAGVGPITVDPTAQNKTIGRRLMADVYGAAQRKNCPGVRLVQAAFHNRSLSLYAKLGYDIREPLACIQGAALNLTLPGRRVRPAREADLEACNALCRRIHGHDRGGELRDAIAQGTARVVERERHGAITGYASLVSFFGHAVGEANEDVQALIGAAEAFPGPGFLLPTRNTELFRWCLAQGLRVVQPMTLMSLGLYNAPIGAFLPSIAY